MSDRQAQSVSRQVANGFRSAAVLLLAVLAIGLVLDGELRIGRSLQASNSYLNTLAGLGELTISAIVLWRTVSRWLREVIAIVWFGALKFAIVFVTGLTVIPPFHAAPRMVAAEMLFYLAIAGVLLSKFLSHQFRLIDKLALIIFLYASIASMIHKDLPIAMLVGIVGLLAARLSSVLNFRVPRRG
jgi:hypothetical protein